MTADRTFALVVGVETYGVAGWVPLDGPARDAIDFTDWLTDSGVPKENIFLFVSPLEKNKALAPKQAVTIQPAEQQRIYDAICTTLQQKKGDLLYVFWGGHGVSDGNGGRYLFYADATKDRKRNLPFDGLRRSLRSSHFGGFSRNVCIVDACANFVETMKFESTLPKDSEIPVGRDGSPDNQFTLYAATDGQAAGNVDGRGVQSRELLALLRATSFPPDMPRVSDQLTTRFEALANSATGRRQMPQTHEVIRWGNKSQLYYLGEEARGDYTGSLIPKLYDRDDQDALFRSRFLADAAAGRRVQAFVIYGEQREQHESFYRRVLERHVRKYAAGKWGDAAGTVGDLPIVEWPRLTDGRPDQLRDDVQIQLATAADGVAPPAADAGGGWAVLGASRFSSHPLTVIPHFIALEEWSDTQRDLIRWYVEQFWGGAPPANSKSEVLLFLLVECSEAMAKPTILDTVKISGWIRSKGGLGVRPSTLKDRVHADLRSFCRDEAAPASDAPSCNALLLEELEPLEAHHIKRWYQRYVSKMANLSDFRCSEESEKVLRDARKRRNGLPRTDHIEDILTAEHAKWMKESRKSA